MIGDKFIHDPADQLNLLLISKKNYFSKRFLKCITI